MLRTYLFAKIHRATVTAANVHYVGSITIDAELIMDDENRVTEIRHAESAGGMCC